VEDEQDFEKLLADLHERFPNMGYLVQNANGTSIVEFYLPEDAKLPEDISQRWPIEELGYDNQQWLENSKGLMWLELEFYHHGKNIVNMTY